MCTTNKKSIPRIFKLDREEKDGKKIFWKKLILKKFTQFEIIAYHEFFDFFENPDLVDVQIGTKHWKMYENLKFQFFFEKPIPDLSFGMGFIKIHQLARFLQPLENAWFSGFWGRFSEMCQKFLSKISGSVKVGSMYLSYGKQFPAKIFFIKGKSKTFSRTFF